MNFKTVYLGSLASEPAKNHSSVRLLVKAALATWLALVFFFGAQDAFVGPPSTPPLRILLSATIPLVLFVAAYFMSRAFKAFVLASDVRLGAALQGWRFAGLGFLALYANGVLPKMFALPAGLGDIAIGATAPWIALALVRRPAFVASRLFVIWNLLGILDLIVAVGTGVLSSGFLGGIKDGVTTAPMARLPLLLIPAYFVPLFVMIHLAALFQARQSAGESEGPIKGER